MDSGLCPAMGHIFRLNIIIIMSIMFQRIREKIHSKATVEYTKGRSVGWTHSIWRDLTSRNVFYCWYCYLLGLRIAGARNVASARTKEVPTVVCFQLPKAGDWLGKAWEHLFLSSAVIKRPCGIKSNEKQIGIATV